MPKGHLLAFPKESKEKPHACPCDLNDCLHVCVLEIGMQMSQATHKSLEVWLAKGSV